MTTWRVLLGDVRETLANLPAQSVQTCITSPPYAETERGVTSETWQCPACGRACSMALLDCVSCGASRPRVECCVLCEQPKWPQRHRSGAEVQHDWPACVNPACEAFGEPTASAIWIQILDGAAQRARKRSEA